MGFHCCSVALRVCGGYIRGGYILGGYIGGGYIGAVTLGIHCCSVAMRSCGGGCGYIAVTERLHRGCPPAAH